MSNRFRVAVVRYALALIAGVVVTSAAHGAAVTGQGTWETTLQARDMNGDNIADAYFDSALNITWLANWNTSGLMNWSTAIGWAAALNVHGVTGWRLPGITDIGNDGCNFSYAGGTDCGYNVDTSGAELAHMYHVTLGNLAYCPPGGATCAAAPQAGFGLTNTAAFVNMQSFVYWYGPEYAPNTAGFGWEFLTDVGSQNVVGKGAILYAVAVHDGDVGAAPIPEPAPLALLSLALAGLGFSKRKKG